MFAILIQLWHADHLPIHPLPRSYVQKSQEEKGEIILVEAMGPGKTAILVGMLGRKELGGNIY